jgi:hypothetical protein
VFGGIWHHLRGHRWAGELNRDDLSEEERRLTGESVEDLTAEGFVAQQLGGIDPDRLLPDDGEPHPD